MLGRDLSRASPSSVGSEGRITYMTQATRAWRIRCCVRSSLLARVDGWLASMHRILACVLLVCRNVSSLMVETDDESLPPAICGFDDICAQSEATYVSGHSLANSDDTYISDGENGQASPIQKCCKLQCLQKILVGEVAAWRERFNGMVRDDQEHELWHFVRGPSSGIACGSSKLAYQFLGARVCRSALWKFTGAGSRLRHMRAVAGTGAWKRPLDRRTIKQPLGKVIRRAHQVNESATRYFE